MNLKKLITSFFVIAILISCASKVTIPLTAEVNVVSEDKYNTIELRSVGYGSNLSNAIYDSERKAFEILFFRGIPNTSIENPLISVDEKAILAKHTTYFNDFFKSRYKSFIMSEYQASPPQTNKGITSLANDIKINIKSLKKDLENNGIIRKFGF